MRALGAQDHPIRWFQHVLTLGTCAHTLLLPTSSAAIFVHNSGGDVFTELALLSCDGHRFDEGAPCTDGDPGDPVGACERACNAADGCVAFFVFTQGDSRGRCCMQRGFSTANGVLERAGGTFYALPGCAECAPGFLLYRDKCLQKVNPPPFVPFLGLTARNTRTAVANRLVVGMPWTAGQSLFRFQATSKNNPPGIVK